MSPARSSAKATYVRRRWPLASTAGRIRILLLVLAVLFSLAGARAVQFQVIEASDKRDEAEKNMTMTRNITPLRGEIRDREGKVLAFTEATVDLVVNPKQLASNGKDPASASDKDKELGKGLPATVQAALTKDVPAANLADANTLAKLTDPSVQYVRVARQVSIGVYNQLQADLGAVDKKTFPVGLGWTVGKDSDPTRVYPMNTVASNIIGYLGDGKGVAGLESSLESTLAGTPGREIYDTSKNGKIPLGNSTLTPAINGTSVTTTLDSGLCWSAQQLIDTRRGEINAEWGFALVMEVKTGKVLCLANTPSFNGNEVGKADPKSLQDPAMIAPYEPGSTMKMLSLAAVIDASSSTANPVTPDTITHVDSRSNGIKSGNNVIHDSDDHGPIDYTTRGILVNSSNQGVIQLTRQVFGSQGATGKQQYADYIKSFGLGQKTNVGLPGENAGIFPEQKIVNDSYTLDSVAFGTSLTVNAMQMAAAVNGILNDGVYIAPSLLASTTNADGKTTAAPAPASHRIVKSTTSKSILDMMENRVLDSYPTIGIPGYRTGAKTGTARMGQNDLIMSIAGVAPVEDPQILVYTCFFQKGSQSGAGISAAGPVYKNIMSLALQRYGIQPSPDADQHCVQEKLSATEAPKNKCTKTK